MSRFLIFSKPMKFACIWLLFQLTKVKRSLLLVLKFSFKLKQIQFNYYRNWRFDNAYLLLDYQFKNAIWIKAGRLKTLNTSGPLLLNLQGLVVHKMSFIVYGLFQKKVIEINLETTRKVKKDVFRTALENLNLNALQLNTPQLLLEPQALDVHLTKPAFHNQNISLNLHPFKLNDYV